MNTVLLLIRHGESVANRDCFFAGQLDVQLEDNGVAQAKLAAEYISENYNVDKIYSSDLKRAYSTAVCVSEKLGIEIIKSEGLREIYAGKWQGMKFDELERDYEAEYDVWKKHIGEAVCNGGESVKQLGSRVMKELTRIAEENPGRTIVVATHATPIRAMQTLVSKGDLGEMENVPWVSNSSLTEFIYHDGKWSMGKVGEDSYLAEYRTEFPPNV